MTPQVIRREIKAFTGNKYVPHGLRKNAVIALLEQGCSHAEVQSMTGQSIPIIQKYAEKVNKRKLSGSAVLKFEKRVKIISDSA